MLKLACVCLLFFAGVTWAQVSSGTLLGDVHDAREQTVPDARVRARNDATGFTRSVVTTGVGSYRIDGLIPGSYTVSAERDGFRTVTAAGVTVELNQKTRYDFALDVATRSESVTVNAHVSPLQTDEASEGYTLETDFVRALPLAGRNIIELVTLGPGAIPRQLGGFAHDIINDLQAGRGAVSLNPPVNGSRSTTNSYILDGAYNTDRNTYSIAITPPMESVAEFRIQTSLASAEFAQSGGAVVDVVTKSGSHSFHGNAFEFFQNEAADAKGFFEVPGLPRGIFRQNQFGASLGGPIDRSTFFFGTYEGLRGSSASVTQHLVPDAAVRAGNFTGRSPIYDPRTLNAAGLRSPFPDNTIPANRLDPNVQKYLSRYEPLPNRPDSTGSNYVDSTPNQNQNDSGSARVDRGFGERSRLYARYSINEESTELAGAFPERPTSETLRAQQGALGYTRTGRDWVADTRFSFTRLRVFDLPLSAFGANVLAGLGIQGLANDAFSYGLPAFTVTDFDTVQDSSTLPQLQRDNTWYFSQGFSRTRGRHTWKTGFQFTHFTMAYAQSQFPRGNFQFNGTFTSDPANPGVTGDAFADFLLGLPEKTQREIGTAQGYLRQNSYAGYIQDDWRITPRITLATGLRYEYTAPFSEDRGGLLNLDYSGLPNPPALRHVESAFSPDYKGFSPRAGLAIRLPRLLRNYDTVFRAGYGIYFSPEIAVESYDLLRNGVRHEINEPGTLRPALTLENGFPQTSSTGLPSYFGVDPKARTPYVQQWSGSIQQELPGRVLCEVAYIGTKGTDLGLFRRFNTPAHVETGQNLPPRPGDLQSLRAFRDLGTLFQIQHIGNSVYHSLQLKGEKRLSPRLMFLASFVWAKSIDDSDSVIPGFFESLGTQDERNLRLERGLSFFDVRYRLSAGWAWAIPHAWKVQLSGTLTLQTGTPLNPVYFATDFANSGTPNRPNVVLGQSLTLPASRRNADHLFNTAAFSDPAPFTFGNAGRDIIPGPGNEVLNVAVHRRFSIHEGQTIEFRAEAFNALNTPNLGIPGPYPDFGPFFGKAFSAGQPRRLQFALRYDF